MKIKEFTAELKIYNLKKEETRLEAAEGAQQDGPPTYGAQRIVLFAGHVSAVMSRYEIRKLRSQILKEFSSYRCAYLKYVVLLCLFRYV